MFQSLLEKVYRPQLTFAPASFPVTSHIFNFSDASHSILRRVEEDAAIEHGMDVVSVHTLRLVVPLSAIQSHRVDGLVMIQALIKHQLRMRVFVHARRRLMSVDGSMGSRGIRSVEIFELLFLLIPRLLEFALQLHRRLVEVLDLSRPHLPNEELLVKLVSRLAGPVHELFTVHFANVGLLSHLDDRTDFICIPIPAVRDLLLPISLRRMHSLVCKAEVVSYKHLRWFVFRRVPRSGRVVYQLACGICLNRLGHHHPGRSAAQISFQPVAAVRYLGIALVRLIKGTRLAAQVQLRAIVVQV